MARRRSSSRAVKRGPKNQVWTTIVNSIVAILSGATKTGTDIVAASDWTTVAGAERATVLRVRGWFAATTKTTTGSFAGGSAFAYVAVYDKDDLSLDASLADTYAEEDIMATWGHVFPFVDSGAGIETWSQEVDIKAMRKITSGQDLRFVATNLTPVTISMSLVLRALVRRGGN